MLVSKVDPDLSTNYAINKSTYNDKRIIPHVAKNTFTSKVIVRNNTSSQQQYQLMAFDVNGLPTGRFDGQISGSAINPVITYHAIDNLFGDSTEVSHLMISDLSDVDVLVSYESVSGGSPAISRETQTASLEWLILSGNWDNVFDGLALINTSDTHSVVTVTHYVDNSASSTYQVPDGINPLEKKLIVLNNLFEYEPESYFLISSTRETTVLSLRFSKPSSTFIWENIASPLSE